MGFPTRAQPEIASHSEGEFWDAVSASASIGKRHPVPDVDSGMCFPFRCPRETASRNSRSDRDNVSRWGGFRKACPALRAHSGMDFPHGGLIWKLRPVLVTDSGIHFPVRPHRGNCVPFRSCGPLRMPSSACSTNKKTGWNENSNRLYIQANSESTTTVRPRERSDG